MKLKNYNNYFSNGFVLLSGAMLFFWPELTGESLWDRAPAYRIVLAWIGLIALWFEQSKTVSSITFSDQGIIVSKLFGSKWFAFDALIGAKICEEVHRVMGLIPIRHRFLHLEFADKNCRRLQFQMRINKKQPLPDAVQGLLDRS